VNTFGQSMPQTQSRTTGMLPESYFTQGAMLGAAEI
jgi:hypothetical protein